MTKKSLTPSFLPIGPLLPANSVSQGANFARSISAIYIGHYTSSGTYKQKYCRVANFHAHTVLSLAELTAAAGLESPQDLTLSHFHRRDPSGDAAQPQIRLRLTEGALLGGEVPDFWAGAWRKANPLSFQPNL